MKMKVPMHFLRRIYQEQQREEDKRLVAYLKEQGQ